MTIKKDMQFNGRESAINRALNGSTNPWLKASAFFSLQKKLVSCMKHINIYSGLVMPSSGWWSPIGLGQSNFKVKSSLGQVVCSTKWQVDKMASWKNVKLKKWQIDKMASG